MPSHHVTHKWRESHVKEENSAILQAYIQTLKQELASMYYSSSFEMVAMDDFLLREENVAKQPRNIKEEA